MKKTTSLLLVLTTLFAVLLSGCGKEPEEPEIIEEKVQAQRITRFVASGRANNQTVQMEMKMVYDGDELLQMNVSQLNKPYMIAVFAGNEDRPAHNVIYNTDGDIVSTTVCQYDSDGNPLKEICYQNGQLAYTAELKCNGRGMVQEEIQTNSQGKRQERITKTYNANGDILSVSYDQQQIRETYAYNSAGDVIQYCYYSGNQLLNKIVYQYRSDGTMVDKVYYTKQESGGKSELEAVAHYVYQYDADGRCIDCYVRSNGEKVAEYTYTYDDQGWLCGVLLKGEHGNGLNVTLEYDVVSVSKEQADELDDFLDALLDTI